MNRETSVASPATPQVRQLHYNGGSGKLFGLYITNWLLTLVTLGVYHFWAKTKLRRFFHENTRFMNEPFTYLGTGREIFVSALKFVLLYIIPPSLVLGGLSAALKDSPFVFIVSLLYFGGFMILRLYARLSGMRYRANRMSWRGIRFALKVPRKEYSILVIKIVFLNLITLGLYRPHGDARFLALFINNTAYGNLNFTYKGKKSELTKGYFWIWLLTPFTLGGSQQWYKARLYRHAAKSTRLGSMEFRYTITGGQLFWLGFSNMLMTIFSFGLLGSYALQRKMRLFTSTLRMRGTPDFAAIKKAAIDPNSAGAADYFGADEDFGF